MRLLFVVREMLAFSFSVVRRCNELDGAFLLFSIA